MLTESGIEFFDNYRDLLKIKGLDLVLEFTGDQSILSDIITKKPPTWILDRQASMRIMGMSKAYAANPLASTLLEASPDGVLVISGKFRILDCNQSIQIPGSVNKDDIIGKHCFEVLYGIPVRARFLQRFVPLSQAWQTKAARSVYEVYGSPNNSLLFRQVTGYPIFDRDGEIVHPVLTFRHYPGTGRKDRRAHPGAQRRFRAAGPGRSAQLPREARCFGLPRDQQPDHEHRDLQQACPEYSAVQDRARWAVRR